MGWGPLARMQFQISRHVAEDKTFLNRGKLFLNIAPQTGMGSQSLQVRPICRAVRMGGSDSPLQSLPRPQPESFPKGRGDIQVLDVDTSMGFGSLGKMEIEPNQVMQTGYTCPPISLLSSESKTRWWATDAPPVVPLAPCFRKPVQLWRVTSDRVRLRAARTGSFLSLRT